MKMKRPVALLPQMRRAPRRLNAVLVFLLSIGLAGPVQAQAPAGGVVVAGKAHITGEGTPSTRVEQVTDRAVIDWRSFAIGASNQVIFLQPSAQSATLNRVTGEQVSLILGRLDANGHVLLINPNGIVFGGGAQINVGSLIATTSNVSNADFMSGRLIFDQPGRPGAGILNAGAITAREGGLVALVAPHVRNDGVIVARLGKVALGGADRFTVDLYGDALINLALSDAHAGQLRQANGDAVASLVTNTGWIETAGGQTVLMTARTAKTVLDSLINTSGTIKADSAVRQGGRILLLGEGGKVDVGGALSAQGTTGGTIQVLGGDVHLSSGAALDAGGAAGGGTIHVGGAWQGQGETYRAAQTTVDAGAVLKANAAGLGSGGEVVVWSDGRTHFAGAVEARGGANGGDGGRMEVSGKGALEFRGQADASATAGRAGSLLLDPAYLHIGADEASTLTRVLRTGTSANLQADIDINVNSAISGGDRLKGGGLTMTAGNNININDFVVTNDGAINLLASQGSVNFGPGTAVFAGSAPITINARGDLRTGYLFGNALSITSMTGSVVIGSLIDGRNGPVSIRAAGDVDIDEPIVNLVTGSNALVVNAGSDINVNAAVDGRGGAEGGAVTMTAAGALNVNDAIVTNNGAVSLTATGGPMTVAPDAPLVSGTASMDLRARGDITTGPMSAGVLAVNSTTGSLAVNGLIDAATGDTRLGAGTDVTINGAIVNGQSGGDLDVSAGRDVTVNAAVDGRGGVAGGAVTMTAGRDLNVNQWLATHNGTVNLTATTGSVSVGASSGLMTGNAPIVMRAARDLATGHISGGSLAATSTAGSVRVNGVIDGSTGRVNLRAGQDVSIDQPVLNLRTGNALTATAGRDVIVNAQIDGRGGVKGGAVTLDAARNVAINDTVITSSGSIDVRAGAGAATMAPGTALSAGAAPISVTAAGDVTTAGISGGSLAATSTGGSVRVNGVIDGSTGPVALSAGQDVIINQPVLNLRSGSAFTASAGQDIKVNAPIDGTGGTAGGTVTLDAIRNIAVSSTIAANDAAIALSAAKGTATFAPGSGLFSGAGAIRLDVLGALTTGALSGGALNVVSRGGSIATGAPISGAGGPITIDAAGQVDVLHTITNPGAGSALTITAGSDINLNARIGRTAPGVASGAVTLTAGHDVNLNDAIVTERGSIAVTARTGAVTNPSGNGLFAGSAPIVLQSAGDLATGAVSGGSLTATSTAGSVRVNGVIDGSTGRVDLNAAQDVAIDQPVLSLRTGNALTATAGRDVIVNAQIDGRGGTTGGAATLTAARNVSINNAVVTSAGAIDITATAGTATMAAGTALSAPGAAITVTAGADITTAGISGGSLTARSTAGSVLVNGVIDGSTGPVALSAGQDVTVNQPVLNLRTGSALTASAGQDVNVNAQIDGRGGVAGGAVTMTATRNVNVNSAIATDDGAIGLSARTGTAVFASDTGLFAGTGAITLDVLGNLRTGALSGGAMTVTSRAGSIATGAPISGQGGTIAMTAAGQVDVNHSITNPGAGSPLTISAGTDITVNAHVGRPETAEASGAVVLTAGRDVGLNDSIVTGNGAIAVTARTGAVTTAADEGLFAGSGSIDVVSGQTLSTPTLVTTGAVTLRSTGGSVNVDKAINGGTGAVTIAAAADVNLNQAIANPRSDAPLTVSAGNDINVNAAIDGRDDVLAGPGGAVTMAAGRDIDLNQSVVANNSAISLTATAGTIATAADKGLFAGSGAIAVTSGETLNTGILETTGTLNIASTGGGVNINRAIGDATGAVTVAAGTAVNVNETITNLKSGSSLTITAGTDINVLAQIDGRGGVAGGAVTMTAGNNLDVPKAIATNNGAVRLTATNGSVILPVGVETYVAANDDPATDKVNEGHTPMQWIVSAGSAPVSITSGGDFSLRSPVVTTGSLDLTSRDGSVSIAAPITDETGAVTITAGNAIDVSHQVKSHNQAIALNAGQGGITVHNIVDYDQTRTPPVNSGDASLTLNSIGDVSVLDSRGITGRTLTIDTRGRIVTGTVGESHPETVVLNADGGIPWFYTGQAGVVTATSSRGPITLGVEGPSRLRVTTGTPGTTDCPTCDITVHPTHGNIGTDVVLNAGGSVNLPSTEGGTLTLIARSGDVNLSDTKVGRLTADAGRDVRLNDILWVEGGPLSLTAGRDVVTIPASPIHISSGESLTLTAGRNVTLNRLEMLGPVSVTATTGNITLNNDIGPHIVASLTLPYTYPFGDVGVASLSLWAGDNISMEGARAEGNVNIYSGGDLTAAREIISTSGTVTITTLGTQVLHQEIPIGYQLALSGPNQVLPVVSPGPRAGLPTPPGLASGAGPGLPAFAEIPVATSNQSIGFASQPGAAGGSVSVAGTPGGATAPAGSGGAIRPGAAGGSLALSGTPGGTAAPAVTTGAVGQPGASTGGAAPQPSGASAPAALDAANALRATGLACEEKSASEGDTGLAAVTSARSEESDRQKAACPPARSHGQSAETKTVK